MHEGLHEVLGIGLQHTVDLVEDGIDIAVKGAIGFFGGWRRGFLFMLITAISSAVFDVLFSGPATRLPA